MDSYCFSALLQVPGQEIDNIPETFAAAKSDHTTLILRSILQVLCERAAPADFSVVMLKVTDNSKRKQSPQQTQIKMSQSNSHTIKVFYGDKNDHISVNSQISKMTHDNTFQNKQYFSSWKGGYLHNVK